MSKFSKLVVVLAAIGASAPLAANASPDGMYQPGPIITQSAPQNQPGFAVGRTAHAQQMQALNRAAQAQQMRSASRTAHVRQLQPSQGEV